MSKYTLTDTEQRIFLAAMAHERKVCRLIDSDKVDDGTCKMLVPVVDSIEGKVKKALFVQGGGMTAQEIINGLTEYLAHPTYMIDTDLLNEAIEKLGKVAAVESVVIL